MIGAERKLVSEHDRCDEAEPASPKPVSLGVGQMVMNAARVDAEANEMLTRGDPYGTVARKHAGALVERIRGEAPGYMQQVGAGGELVPTSQLAENPRALQFQDTVRHPDYVAVDASRDRLELAHASGSLEAALDLADSIRAENSLEKMLTHQLAASHRATMKIAAQVNRRLNHLDGLSVESDRAQVVSIEAARLAGAAARMMSTFQQGLLALQKLRTGGQQQVVVQHQYVTKVEGGGQAVIAGEVTSEGGGRNGRGGSRKMGDEPHANGWRAHLALAHASSRCGAKCRDGTPCRSPAMPNGRCRMHGGKSTGPRTPEGLERSRKARWQHGHYTAAAKAARAEARASMQLLRWLLAQLPE